MTLDEELAFLRELRQRVKLYIYALEQSCDKNTKILAHQHMQEWSNYIDLLEGGALTDR